MLSRKPLSNFYQESLINSLREFLKGETNPPLTLGQQIELIYKEYCKNHPEASVKSVLNPIINNNLLTFLQNNLLYLNPNQERWRDFIKLCYENEIYIEGKDKNDLINIKQALKIYCHSEQTNKGWKIPSRAFGIIPSPAFGINPMTLQDSPPRKQRTTFTKKEMEELNKNTRDFVAQLNNQQPIVNVKTAQNHFFPQISQQRQVLPHTHDPRPIVTVARIENFSYPHHSQTYPREKNPNPNSNKRPPEDTPPPKNTFKH